MLHESEIKWQWRSAAVVGAPSVVADISVGVELVTDGVELATSCALLFRKMMSGCSLYQCKSARI
jgi:hypothetical protein